MIERMDAADIDHAFPHRAEIRPSRLERLLPHASASVVADAVTAKHPERFSGLIGIDPFTWEWMACGNWNTPSKTSGFIGAHVYPHWFELAARPRQVLPVLRQML